jgi:hypothetical protein
MAPGAAPCATHAQRTLVQVRARRCVQARVQALPRRGVRAIWARGLSVRGVQARTGVRVEWVLGGVGGWTMMRWDEWMGRGAEASQ